MEGKKFKTKAHKRSKSSSLIRKVKVNEREHMGLMVRPSLVCPLSPR